MNYANFCNGIGANCAIFCNKTGANIVDFCNRTGASHVSWIYTITEYHSPVSAPFLTAYNPLSIWKYLCRYFPCRSLKKRFSKKARK